MEMNPKEVARQLLENRVKFGARQLEELAAAVHAGGGRLVQFTDDPGDGDWCGNSHFPHWPPKKLDDLLSFASRYQGELRIFPWGIPAIDSYRLVIQRNFGR
jgi:hypothetical protein